MGLQLRAYLMLALFPAVAGDTPLITDAQRARFWRAQAEVMGAQARLDKAVAAFQAVQTELIKTCGEQQLMAGADAEPVCAPKPEKTR